MKNNRILAQIALLVAFLALLIPKQGLAQDNANFAKVVPPSPTSGVFRQYGEHQPSLATGMVGIPIPLFEIKADNLKLPFSLQYSTAGINIMDRPYPCGYGWVFSPGLRVTRTVLGRADGHYPFALPSSGADYNALKRAIVDDQHAIAHGIALNNLIDMQHDIFTVHLPSGNYTFLINHTSSNYEVINVGHSLKIVKVANKGFEITDEYGVLYKFGMYANETVGNNYVEFPGNQGYYTAWLLRDIILPNGESLQFTWRNVNINTYTPSVATPIVVDDYKNMCFDTFNPTVSDYGGMVDYASFAYANVKMLEKVVFPSGEINITYKSTNDPFITKFEVKDKGGNVRSTTNFTYGANSPQLDHTLLQSILIDGEKYQFTYNSKRFGKASTSLDYWGFFNGKNNMTLIPKVRFNLFNNYVEINQITPNFTMEVGNADRSVDTAAMKAFILTRITYPTGGYSIFEYEPHQFSNKLPASNSLFSVVAPAINSGGGLRLSKVTSKADASATAITKTYKYGNNENGLANANVVPTLDTFVDEFFYLDQYQMTTHSIRANRRLIVNALSNYSKYLVLRNPIWYSTVTEYTNDHKREYKFEYIEDLIQHRDLFKFAKKPYVFYYMGLFQEGPRMKEQTDFKKNGQNYDPIKKVILNYQPISHPNLNYAIIENEIVDRKIVFSGLPYQGPDVTDYDLSQNYCYLGAGTIAYNRIPYRLYIRYYRLTDKQIITTVGNGQQITETEEYTYYANSPQLSKVISSTSNTLQKLTKEYKYAPQYTDAIYVTMTAKNMIAPVVEEITRHGTLEIHRKKTNYTNSSTITTGLIRPLSIQTSTTGIGGLYTEVNFDSYDTKGKLRQYTPFRSPVVAYLWGYDGQYPIAEGRNANQYDIAYVNFEATESNLLFASVTSALDDSAPTGRRVGVLTAPNSKITKYGLTPGKKYVLTYWIKDDSSMPKFTLSTVEPAEHIRTKGVWKCYRHRVTGGSTLAIEAISGSMWIDDIRLHPADATLDTYTYDPLVGMTSHTDASGNVRYYEYDGFGRLRLVRDLQGNLVEDYKYHYRP